jgi:glutamate 5-kinase
VTGAVGTFEAGQVVDVVDPTGTRFARGRVSMSAGDLRSVLGRRTQDLPVGLPNAVVHRDDLIVLEPVTEIGNRFYER